MQQCGIGQAWQLHMMLTSDGARCVQLVWVMSHSNAEQELAEGVRSAFRREGRCRLTLAARALYAIDNSQTACSTHPPPTFMYRRK